MKTEHKDCVTWEQVKEIGCFIGAILFISLIFCWGYIDGSKEGWHKGYDKGWQDLANLHRLPL